MVSSKLSPLQHAFVDAFFSEPSSFFLTGGGALAGFHLGHRRTDDLDLFSPPVEAMELAVQRLRRAAESIGASVEAVQETPDFRRFAVRRGTDTALVDLVIDRAPQLVDEKPLAGRVLAQAGRDFGEALDDMRREIQERGLPPPTADEIDAEINATRAECTSR